MLLAVGQYLTTLTYLDNYQSIGPKSKMALFAGFSSSFNIFSSRGEFFALFFRSSSGIEADCQARVKGVKETSRSQ